MGPHRPPSGPNPAVLARPLPIDTFSSNGAGEQFAAVFPTEDVIAVRIGALGGVQGYEGILANDLAALVLAALTEM